jgi:HD-GYP domain-containing protein (c-di-GMP phosphodiesterase class II)
MGASERRELYLLALLHSVGCTADAFEAARQYGDDITLRAAYADIDPSRPPELLGFLARNAGTGQPTARRVSTFARTLAGGPAGAAEGFRSHCEVATRLATRLALPEGTRTGLGFVFERWDGKGQPDRASGADIPRSARFLHVARDMVLLARRDGVDAARRLIEKRSGTAYDPDVVLLTRQVAWPEGEPTWQQVLDLDPAPSTVLDAESLDVGCLAIADFADLKSPSTLGHSRRVADLAEAAGWRSGLKAEDVADLRRAALLADVGRVGVSNNVWDKPGSLTDAEWEQVRLHPYITQRALARADGLAGVARIACAHHERVGGGGYHVGVDAAVLPMPERLLAAADTYVTKTSARPHRPALSPEETAAHLRASALDSEAVEAVLAAAGHAKQPVRRELPAGLTEREVEVLVRLARGSSNKEVAAELGITPKTVGHHVEHVYTKIGVSTRAAAALFAVEHGLL